MTNHFALEMPFANGTTVQQGHADYCLEHGHATWKVDGVDQGICPRCGDVTNKYNGPINGSIENNTGIVSGDDLALNFGGNLHRISVAGETTIWQKVSA